VRFWIICCTSFNQRKCQLTLQDKMKSNLSTFNRNLKIMGPSLGLGGLSPDTGAKLVGRGGRRTV
jgi:hypothetical protein